MLCKAFYKRTYLIRKSLTDVVFKAAVSSASSIFALATAAKQKCGVAVVRVSGKKCSEVLLKMTKSKELNFEPRKMYFKDIFHPINNEKLDKGLVVWFKGNF